MFDFKQEVEQYSGKKIDINKSIDQVEKEAKAKGQKIDSKYLKAIKTNSIKMITSISIELFG